MSTLHDGRPRRLTAGMQRMLFVASGLVFAVGIPLFLLSTQTDVYFAWTIQPPLTAAFLGGAYWAACVLELMAGRERLWANARTSVPAVIIFTALTLIVTLLHIDRFHFGAPEPITRAGTWVWLAVYASVPIVMALLLAGQLRAPGGDPPRRAPLAPWARALMWLVAAMMIALGVALLIAPAAGALLWPWMLTPLTGRAIGAWLVGLGVAAGQAALENDLRRVRPVMVASVVFCLLQFIALARFAGDFDWGGPRGWLYLAFLALFLLVGSYGWLAGRQAAGQTAPAV